MGRRMIVRYSLNGCGASTPSLLDEKKHLSLLRKQASWIRRHENQVAKGSSDMKAIGRESTEGMTRFCRWNKFAKSYQILENLYKILIESA